MTRFLLHNDRWFYILAFLACLAIVVFPGCRIIKPQTDSYRKDSVSVNYRKDSVKVKGGKVTGGVNMDSLMQAVRNAAKSGSSQATKPVIIRDESGKVQLQYWVDQFGKLQMSCESKDQTVQFLVKEVTRLTTELNRKTQVEYKTPPWAWITIGVLSSFVILFLFYLLLTFKRV